jgi:pimeloyl-ACP methyl ester carboxylesterase
MSADLGRAAIAGVLLWFVSAGCGGPQIVNPSFPITEACARRDLQRMHRRPRPLARPLVVISGFMDPGIAALSMRDQMASVTGDRRIATISLFECMSFGQCRRKVIDVVGRAFPNSDPRWTTEVDVIGFSMGGLAARLAAANDGPADRRLRIHRLFTIDTPNRGAARAAELPVLHPLQRGMRPGSPMLVALNARPPGYAIVAYARLNDKPVGVRNEAVAGCPLWWVATPPFSNPHTGAVDDPRILADIARRLRGEMPLTTLPPALLPPGS